MRISAFSIAGLAAAGLLAIALWPDGAQVKSPQVVAQTGDKTGVPGGKPAKNQKEKSVEEKLAQRIDAEYPETPFKDVLESLKERTGLQMYVNRKAITAVLGDLEAPITMNLKQVRLDMVLDLVLEQAGEGQLAYVERDGILIVSTSEALSGASEVKVYNCRDLLAMASPVPQAQGMMMGPGGMMPGGGGSFGLPGNPGPPSTFEVPSTTEEPAQQEEAPRPNRLKFRSFPSEPSDPQRPGVSEFPPAGAAATAIPGGIAPQIGPPAGGASPHGAGPAGGMGGMMAPGMGGMGGGGFGGGMENIPPRTEEEIRAERLMHLITTAVKPDSWQDMGGFGTISEYKGLIVINHNARTHKEVENVLTMLCEAAGLPTTGPVGGGGGLF